MYRLLFLLSIIFNSINFIYFFDINLKGKHGKGYYLDILIGTNPQKLKVLIDTGSSNFAIAASKNRFIGTYFNSSNSSTLVDLHKNVTVQYNEGAWFGRLVSDLVQLPSVFMTNIVVRSDISLIFNSNNFYVNNSDWQGILGLAYPTISRPDNTVLSWVDAYQKETNSSSVSFILKLCGTRVPRNSNHFGSFKILNHFKNTSRFFITPLVKDWFYEIVLKDVLVNKVRINVTCNDLNDDKTIIDSGTTNVKFPGKVYKKLIAHLYNRTKELGLILTPTFWNSKELSCYNTSQKWNILPNISIEIASSHNSYFVLYLPGSSYIRESYDNSKEGTKYCYKLAIEESSTGTVLGVVALEGFEILFNRTAKTVGFSKSDCGPNVHLEGPFFVTDSITNLFESCINHKNITIANQSGVSMFAISLFVIALMILFILLACISCTFLKLTPINTLTSNVFLTLNRIQLTNED